MDSQESESVTVLATQTQIPKGQVTFLIKTGMFATQSVPLKLKSMAHKSQKHLNAPKLAELLRVASYRLPWKSHA